MDTPEKKKWYAFLKNRRFKYGSMATGFAVVFIAIVVLVNVILSIVVTKYPLSWDLTSTQKFKLSDESVKYVKSIKTDIYITVLATKSELTSNSTVKTAYESLQQYPEYNSKIHVDYKDLNSNPVFAKAFSSESLADYDVIVATGSETAENGKYKVVSIDDMFPASYNSETYETEYNENDTENVIDSAIMTVTSANTPKIYFTTGHGEGDSSTLQSALKVNNYTIDTLDLATKDIPSDATTIAIVSPTADFTDKEITKISNFLTNDGKYGKSLAVFFDPSESSLPNLEALVQAWGVSVGTGVVYDESGYDTFVPAASNLNSDTFGKITTSYNTAIGYTRPLTILFTEKDSRTVTSLMQTSSTSKLWNTKDLSATFKASTNDKSGPFDTLTLTTKSTYDSDNNKLSSYVLVSGSTTSWTNSTLMGATQLNNQKDIVTAFNTISGNDVGMNVASKDLETESITITDPQKLAFTIIFVILIPLLILVGGLSVYLRRRHL